MICDVNEFAITLISNQINDAFLQHFIGDTSKQAFHFVTLRYVKGSWIFAEVATDEKRPNSILCNGIGYIPANDE